MDVELAVIGFRPLKSDHCVYVYYTNIDTPGTARQLDAEAVAAEVDYTMTNTQPSCSRGGESDRIPRTFKKATGLPQAAHW